MKQIIVKGNRALHGQVDVSGSKNAALPILFATILTKGISEIKGLPKIGDVTVALEILVEFGAKVAERDGITFIDTRLLEYRAPSVALVSKIRASTYLIGSCLSRFGICYLDNFGGCNFSVRPIDMHISTAVSMGARIQGNRLCAENIKSANINFAKSSVGATVNAILLASSAEGRTVIRGFAKEPHINTLIEFLISAGASIIYTDNEIIIEGRSLHGGRVEIPGDTLEAASYLAAGVITGGCVSVHRVPTSQMESVVDCFNLLGCNIEIDGETVTQYPIASGSYIELTTNPFPSFPTDLQPIFATLFSRFCGGKITDNVWKSRFGYLETLASFGVEYKRFENTAIISRSNLVCANVAAPDLRGGMACLLTALSVDGESKIDSAETIFRGYENLEQKLLSLGAYVKVIDV